MVEAPFEFPDLERFPRETRLGFVIANTEYEDKSY